jgi:hypothetical protein
MKIDYWTDAQVGLGGFFHAGQNATSIPAIHELLTPKFTGNCSDFSEERFA